MTKSDLINALAEKEGLRAQEAFDIINLIFDGFTRTLKKDGRIEIRGFGSYTHNLAPTPWHTSIRLRSSSIASISLTDVDFSYFALPSFFVPRRYPLASAHR